MRRTLPPSPSLEQLRNQARDLLNAYRAHDPDAVQSVLSHLSTRPDAAASPEGTPHFRLAETLFVIAREHGFASWPKLKQHVEAMASSAAVPESASPAPSATRERLLSPLRRLTRERAEEIRGLARERNVEEIVARVSCLPLRDILALREELVQHGGHAELVGTLLLGLDHPKARIRFDAAHAMDHFADERCAEPLRRLLNDPVPRVRRVALHSLACDRCKAAPLPKCGDLMALVIEQALHDPSINVRRHAAYNLGGECYDPRAVAALETLLARETDRNVLRGARWALRRQRELAEAAREERAAFEQAMAKVGDVEPEEWDRL